MVHVDDWNMERALARMQGGVAPAPARAGGAPPRRDPTRAPAPDPDGKTLGGWLDEVRAWAAQVKEKPAVAAGDEVHPKVVVVGKAPGTDEVRCGRPFSGKSGKELERMLEYLGVGLEPGGGALATNASFWFARAGEAPKEEDRAAVQDVLGTLVAMAAPRVLIAAGAEGATATTGLERPVGKLRGRWIPARWSGAPQVRATYHPAYLLRSPEGWREVKRDLEAVAQRLRGEDGP